MGKVSLMIQHVYHPCEPNVQVMSSHSGKFDQIGDALLQLVTSGPMGRTLFEPAVVHVVALQVGDLIQARVNESMASSVFVTVALPQNEIVACAVGLQEHPGLELFPAKRKIDSFYGKGHLYGMEVVSLMDEVETRCWGAMKYMAMIVGRPCQTDQRESCQ